MGINKFLDARPELPHVAVDAALQLLGRQLGKPALHETDPRGIGGRELHMETRTLAEPVPNKRRFVRHVVVHDDVHVERPRDLGVDQIEGRAKLRRTVMLMNLGDHFTGLRVQHREQRGRAILCVIERPSFDLSRLHRQQRVRPIEA